MLLSAPRAVTANFTAITTTDTTPPTVSLTPLSAAVLNGSVTLTATANDNVGVAGVQFRSNGQNLGSEDTTAPYSIPWNTIAVPNGAYTLTAVARDAAGNSTVSSPINVTIDNKATDLRGAYSFDLNANDDSGHGRHGVLSGATTVAQGRFCGAFSFDGVNDWVTIAHDASLNLQAGMTLSAWVRPTSLARWTTVILKERADGLAYALYASDDANRPPAGYVRAGGSDRRVVALAPLPLNTWTHIAVTSDTRVLRFYVNGQLAASQTIRGQIATSSNPLRIGGNAVWNEFFQGLIDEVRIYGRARTQQEIQDDMNRPVRATCQ